MLHKMLGRRVALLKFSDRTWQCLKRWNVSFSSGSAQLQTSCGIQGQKPNKISQYENGFKAQIKMCNSLSEVASLTYSQGANIPSSYIHDLLEQVRTIIIQIDSSASEITNVQEGLKDHDFHKVFINFIVNNLSNYSLNELASLLEEITILGPEAKDEITNKLTEQIICKLNRASSEEFEVFLRFLSTEGKSCYRYLKNDIPSCDKTFAEKCFELTKKHSSLEIGPFFLLALAKLGFDFRLDPIPLICQHIFQNIDNYNMKTVSILGELLSHLKLRTSWYSSCVIRIFQRKFDQVSTPSELARLTYCTIHLCSADFKTEIWEKFQDVFYSSADVEIDILLSMMQSSASFNHEIQIKILERCSALIALQAKQMTPSQMLNYLIISQHCFFKVEPLYEEVFDNLKNNVLQLNTKRDIVLAMDLLFRHPGSSDHFGGLVNNFLRLAEENGMEELSKICAVTLRLGNQYPELVTQVKESCSTLLPGIHDAALLNSLARFFKLKSSSKSQVNILKDKLMRASYRAISPREHSCVVSGLGKLSVPPSQIDPFVWSKIRKLLPNLCRESSRSVLMMLGRSKYFEVNPVDHAQLCNLQQDVFQKILGKKPPSHLLLLCERNLSSNQNWEADEGLSNGVSRYRLHKNITKSNVIGVALYLNHINMFYQDLLDHIVETIHDDIESFTPYELKDVLNLLALCNSSHPKIDFITHRCATILSEFFEKFSPIFVIESAFYLAQLQVFNRNLLDKVFTWKFLDNFERLVPSPISSHILMELNRAVCLECPEMQAPWFHPEVLQANAFSE